MKINMIMGGPAFHPDSGRLELETEDLNINMAIKDLDSDLEFITEALILYKNKLKEKEDKGKEKRF